jgi:hypothetical protein
MSDDIVTWLKEEAPWAVQHLHKRVGPASHQGDAAKYLVFKTAQAADEIERLREALRLADAALSGAHMNMRVVERKVRAALEEGKK